jgi:hypothetical protein
VNACPDFFGDYETPRPDANGQFATPADGAKFMASFDIPQTPLQGKRPFLKDWQDKGSTDPAQIDAWYAQYKCNFGSIAKAALDGFYVLEADSVEVRKTFKKDTGSDFTARLIIQSGVGRGHRWYKHNAESLALSNIGQVDAAGFSLRLNNEQCVSPGSIHPERKTQYVVINPASQPDVASPQEISWLRTKKVQAKEQSNKAVVRDGERILIKHGSMHAALVSQSGRLWAQGFDPDDIPDMLIKWAHANCEAPIDENKVRHYARGSNWKQGEPGAEQVYIGGSGTNTEDVPEQVQEVKDDLPAFPRLSGLLTELCDAVCPDIPYEYKIATAITHWGLMRSDKDMLEGDPTTQPRFYTCLIGKPQQGKSAAMNEIRKYMAMLGCQYSSMSSVDSGPALVDEFQEQLEKKTGEGLAMSNVAKVLLDTDEMSDLFEKSKVTATSRNSLFTELLKLYEGNITGNRSRKAGKTQLNNAYLAIVAGATPQGYERMWTGTGGGSTGLQSRFILISSSAPKMGVTRAPSNDRVIAEKILPALNKIATGGNVRVSLSAEARTMLEAWWGGREHDNPSDTRVDDMVKRLLIILGVTTGRHVIDRELMTQAIAFGDYVIAAREVFNAPDSFTWIQAEEDAIRKVGHRHTLPMTQNEFRRLVQPNRRPGGLGPFRQAWGNLLAVEELKPAGKTEKGSIQYKFS